MGILCPRVPIVWYVRILRRFPSSKAISNATNGGPEAKIRSNDSGRTLPTARHTARFQPNSRLTSRWPAVRRIKPPASRFFSHQRSRSQPPRSGRKPWPVVTIRMFSASVLIAASGSGSQSNDGSTVTTVTCHPNLERCFAMYQQRTAPIALEGGNGYARKSNRNGGLFSRQPAPVLCPWKSDRHSQPTLRQQRPRTTYQNPPNETRVEKMKVAPWIVQRQCLRHHHGPLCVAHKSLCELANVRGPLLVGGIVEPLCITAVRRVWDSDPGCQAPGCNEGRDEQIQGRGQERLRPLQALGVL